MSSLSLRSQSPGIDKPLLFAVLGLVIFGVLMVFNASSVDSAQTFGDQFYFARRQALWGIVGIFTMLGFSFLPYTFLRRLAIPIFAIAVFLLIAVLVPGFGVKASGASRWIVAGPVSLQPGEFVKLALVIFLASLLAQNRHLLPFLGTVGIIGGLVMLQPDLGTTGVLVAISIILYFASGAPLWYFLGLVPLVGLSTFVLVITSSYRKERLLTFLNSNNDPLGSSYHIRQILLALGSGGIFGVGLGQSRQKYLFLPEPMTDSIFAIIGEELGFIGAGVLVLAFIFAIWRGLVIAGRTPDPFGRLLALGITAWIGIQAFINIAAMVAIIPLTGLPLPFISYGGSSLIVMLAGVGMLLNISKHR